MKFKFFAKVLVTASLLGLAACGGGNSFVKNVQVSTYSANNSQFVSFKTNVDNAQVIMPIAQLPIVNAKKPDVLYGFVQITPNLTAGTEFRLDLNINALTGFRPTDPVGTLPNGLPIPVAGFNPATSFSVGITQGSRLYMDLDLATKKAIIGAAIGVKQLSTGIAGGIFLPFGAAGNGTNGIAGIFTGPQAFQSGFAIFADVSSALQTLGSRTLMAKSASAPTTTVVTFPAASRNSSEVYNVLQRVNSSNQRVNLQ